MPTHERTPTDNEHSPPEASGRVCYTLGHARQNPFDDRLRRRAAVLAVMAISAAFSAPGILASGDPGHAVLWSGLLLVLASLFVLTLLAMRRRSKAERRGIRLLDPVEPERSPLFPATGG